MKIIYIIFVTLLSFQTLAHPGVGIVHDRKGNIFYSDLKHIWKITPGGRKIIALKNVHIHELYIDKRWIKKNILTSIL
jgi:hypothetical protein